MLLPLLGVGGGLSGLGVLGAVQLCGVLSVDSVTASEQYVSSSIPDSEGWPRGAWAGPRHHHQPLRHLRQGEPVQWPGEVAAAEKEKIFCHVECDAMEANLAHNHQEAEAGG